MSSVNQDESWRSGGHLARMSHLLDSGFMADCTFLLTDQQGEEARISAHRLHLSHASPVFQAMLSEVWRSEESREIRIRDVTAETFRLLLGYVYTGQTPDLDMDSALELLAAAHMYLVSDLLDACVKHITASLSAEVCQVLEVASTLSLDGLHNSALQYLVDNTSAVLRAASFPECSAATLRLILEQDSLSLSSELELVQACLRWGQQQMQQSGMGDVDAPWTVRAALGDLVFLLRLRGLTTEQLARHVVPSGLLTDKEMNVLFSCLVTNKDSPMPEGFTDKIRTYRKKRTSKGNVLAEQKVGCAGVTQLHDAVYRGDVQAVRHLLEAEVPVEARKDTDGDTPLKLAAEKGHVEVVRLLLDHGAHTEVKSGEWKGTPLHYAAYEGRTEVVKLLIERGSEVNATDSAGDTPLLEAVEEGYSEVVGVLLEAGADPRATNVAGDAALHLAIGAGKLSMVRMLLEAGANPRATNKKGETALLTAALKEKPTSEMMAIIKRYL